MDRRGFAERGTKGWAWLPGQYLETIPALAADGLTFLMLCYASMADVEHVRWGTPGCNRWWEPLPAEKRRAYERVVGTARDHGLETWFSLNPNLFADRFARADVPADVDALWAHYGWMQGLGVRTFVLALDDIGRGLEPEGQAALVNAIHGRLRERDPGARLVFCPTIYWGDGGDPGHRAYLAALRDGLAPDVLVFWTGDAVVTPRITRRAGEGYRAAIGRDLVVWDNYPCNDDAPTMHLGPLRGRDPDLPAVAVAYVSNPMARQHRLNRLPLLTCAAWAGDPAAYDPEAAVERAIATVGWTEGERVVLRDLVRLYPGSVAVGGNQYVNPVRERAARGDAGVAAELADATSRFAALLGDRYPVELACLEADLAWIGARPGQ